MKEQITLLSKLAHVRGKRVREIEARVVYQRNRCQHYRDNIAGLTRLCNFTAEMRTSMQRHNQQHYKATLHKMMELQQRELAAAENALARLERELQAALRHEKVVTNAVDARRAEWSRTLAKQEQKIQDGLAVQTWWQHQAS
ncbi:flagellar export protein FliJ [Alkalilimnicola ehrlichii]|uniref:flagellar FliJ family protein n=1 Tax=Alkalilimnicola ehrlichii TaxID=351052 RepID=UPI000E2EB0E1|nr:flagellar FliJ family protein [Alkalilimnicola ehrlichii]RFA30717.1 flagellar export protein FliJ [Alkalilimnicola ehrlichii]